MDILDTIQPEHKKLLEELIAAIRQGLRKGEPVAATWFIGNTPAGRVMPLPVDTSSERAKHLSAELARRMAVLLSADFVLMVTEAWSLPPSKMKDFKSILREYGSVSSYPGRVDVLSFLLETPLGYVQGSAALLPDPPSKRRRKLGEFVWAACTEGEGTFTRILPQRDDAPPSSAHMH